MSIGVDVTPVEHEDEALVLMLHHLKLAAAYFEATPMGFSVPEHFSRDAILAWVKAMEALYPENEWCSGLGTETGGRT